jgi:hypothetical protein
MLYLLGRLTHGIALLGVMSLSIFSAELDPALPFGGGIRSGYVILLGMR